MTKFNDLGLSEPLLRAVAAEGYTTPTPIQAKAIPPLLAGQDLLACAQTGTGKTAAFALPIIERLSAQQPAADKHRRAIRVLVLSPTRELAAQIHESFQTYGRHTSLRTAVIYGKVSQHHQVRTLSKGVDILIATPGRLLDLMSQQLLDLNRVETFVLDEADRMLDMGFIHDVRKIAQRLPQQRQTLLFSATLPAEVRQIAAQMMRQPIEVRAETEKASTPKIEQSVYHVPQKQKSRLLVQLLGRSEMKRVIVFTRTKHGADRLERDLNRAGVRAAALHGNKSQNARERALESFKSERPPVLVATDVASRGIDVDLISHVVNFDLPHEPETYVHRIGRTGRAGESGIALSFCDTAEQTRLRAIERLLRSSIPVNREQIEHGEPLPFIRGESGAGQGRGVRGQGTGDRSQETGDRSQGTGGRGRKKFRPFGANKQKRRRPEHAHASSHGPSSNGSSSNGHAQGNGPKKNGRRRSNGKPRLRSAL